MSLGAWGDEGNVPTDWSETAMRHDFDAMQRAFLDWVRTYKDEFPYPEFEQIVEAVETQFDDLSEAMTGEL